MPAVKQLRVSSSKVINLSSERNVQCLVYVTTLNPRHRLAGIFLSRRYRPSVILKDAGMGGEAKLGGGREGKQAGAGDSKEQSKLTIFSQRSRQNLGHRQAHGKNSW